MLLRRFKLIGRGMGYRVDEQLVRRLGRMCRVEHGHEVYQDGMANSYPL